MRQRQPLAALLLAIILPLGACGDDGTVPEEEGVHGTYPLETVNGSGLPFVVRDDTEGKVELMDGEIVLRADGTFSDAINLRITPAGGTAGPEADVITGTFVLHTTTSYRFTPGPGQGGDYSVDIEVGGGLSQQINALRLVYGR